MKGSDIITADLRNTLDDEANGRWTDEVLLGYVRDGVEKIRTEHPESRYNAQARMEPVSVPAMGSDPAAAEFYLDPIYRLPLMHYVAHRAFLSEAADSNDEEQAKIHLGAFEAFWSPQA